MNETAFMTLFTIVDFGTFKKDILAFKSTVDQENKAE